MVAKDPPNGTHDLQEQTLRLFLALRLQRPIWAQTLLLGIGLGGPGRAFALASLAAGSASLFLEDDPALLRQAQREGGTTFTVTALEEAIRILKNEVRQGRAIAVALRQTPATAMAEMLRRGLQPQALAFSRPASEAEAAHATVLQQRGAVPLTGFGLVASANAEDLSASLATALGTSWRIHTEPATTPQQRRNRDAELLVSAESCISSFGQPLAALAVDWLRVAPLLLPRALGRSVLQPSALSPEESSQDDC